jgi:hypothetical protein
LGPEAIAGGRANRLFDPLPPLLDEQPQCSAQAGWRDLPGLLGLELLLS